MTASQVMVSSLIMDQGIGLGVLLGSVAEAGPMWAATQPQRLPCPLSVADKGAPAS